VPPVEALDKAFDISGFTGRWYITAGLNPLFDTFDCQVGRGGRAPPRQVANAADAAAGQATLHG
jgi:violaxanthin de-epoxidase